MLGSSLDSLRLGSYAESFSSLVRLVYEEVSGFVVLTDGAVYAGVVTFGFSSSSSSDSSSELLDSSSDDSDSSFFSVAAAG